MRLGRTPRGRRRTGGQRPLALVPGLAVLLGLASVGVGCDDGPVRTQAAYCAELAGRRGVLQPPPDVPLSIVYADAAKAFDALEPRAPAEIAGDVTATTAALHQLADLAGDAEGDPAKADDRRLVEVALASKASTDRVNAYNRERCGVDTSAATSP